MEPSTVRAKVGRRRFAERGEQWDARVPLAFAAVKLRAAAVARGLKAAELNTGEERGANKRGHFWKPKERQRADKGNARCLLCSSYRFCARADAGGFREPPWLCTVARVGWR